MRAPRCRSPTSVTTPEREALAQSEAQEILDRGVELLGHAAAGSPVGRHVVTDRSTPEGLATLAAQEGADVIVSGR